MDSDGQSLVLRWNHKNAALSFSDSSLKSKLTLDGLVLPLGEDIWKWEPCSMVLYDSLSSQGRILGLLHYSDQGPRVKTEVAGETKGEEGSMKEIKYHSILLWLCLLNPTRNTCLFSFLKELSVRAKLIIGLPGKPKLITAIVYWVWALQETPGVNQNER